MRRVQAAQVDPDNYSAIGNASLCAFRLKRYRQGANLAVYALLVKPTWAKAWVRLAQCAEHLKFVSHLADFPVACVKMAMHLNPASTEEYEQALSVTHPSSEWCDVSGAVHNFRWMFIAQKVRLRPFWTRAGWVFSGTVFGPCCLPLYSNIQLAMRFPQKPTRHLLH